MDQPLAEDLAAPTPPPPEPATRKPRGSARRSLLAALVPAVLGAIATLLVLALLGPRPVPSAEGLDTRPDPVQVTGRLFCLGCLLAERAPDAVGVRTLAPGLAAGEWEGGLHDALELRGRDGRAWRIVATGAEGAVLALHDNAGREATIYGVADPDVNVLRATRVLLRQGPEAP